MYVISIVYGVQYFPYFGGNAIWDTENAIWDAENAIWDTGNAIWDTPIWNTEHSRSQDKREENRNVFLPRKWAKFRHGRYIYFENEQNKVIYVKDGRRTESGILFWWTRHNNNKQNIQFNLFLFLSSKVNLLSRFENECARESLKWRSKHVKTKENENKTKDVLRNLKWRDGEWKSLPVCFCLWQVNLFVLFMFWFRRVKAKKEFRNPFHTWSKIKTCIIWTKVESFHP